MRLVKSGRKKPNWRDKLPDGSMLYACPYCMPNGKRAQSATICIKYTAPLEKDGKIKLRDHDKTAFCYECGETVAIFVKGEWLKVHEVE